MISKSIICLPSGKKKKKRFAEQSECWRGKGRTKSLYDVRDERSDGSVLHFSNVWNVLGKFTRKKIKPVGFLWLTGTVTGVRRKNGKKKRSFIYLVGIWVVKSELGVGFRSRRPLVWFVTEDALPVWWANVQDGEPWWSFPNDLKGFFLPSVLSYGFLCILRTYNKYSVWCTDELLSHLWMSFFFTDYMFYPAAQTAS